VELSVVVVVKVVRKLVEVIDSELSFVSVEWNDAVVVDCSVVEREVDVIVLFMLSLSGGFVSSLGSCGGSGIAPGGGILGTSG
jgi:hypothetical protein